MKHPEGLDFAARFEWPGETNRAWTWRCRPGAHTEGELALVATVGPQNTEKRPATYRQTEFLSHFYPNIRRGFVEAYPLMTTFEWLIKARADLRDWSGYDLFRVDVRCEAAPVKIWLALEDEILEPPVMRTYKIPAGKWVTIELDLNDAVRTRGLELAKIANFWLLGRAEVRAEVRIDNIRIVKRGVSAVTKGESEVFFTATGLTTVLRWDGNSWIAAPIQCEDGGMLSLAGDVVTLFTTGKLNRKWRGLDWSRRAILRYYRRSPTGRWEGPLDLTGEFNIHEYRSFAGFSVPQYSPVNFVPLVWSDYDEGAVKLLKVPINLSSQKSSLEKGSP